MTNQKTLRKEVVETFESKEVKYVDIKSVEGKGPYSIKKTEKEFACC